jgi:quercetin dioxygenase-like cupin family protein
MTMSKMKVKLMLAGVFVACAFGGIAIGIAWATPGAGTTFVHLAGPVALDELDLTGESDTHEIEIKTTGAWVSRVLDFTMAPGGHTGWHSHPGPAFVMINEGTMTLEQADGTSVKYGPGTGFAEEPGHVHIARNEGTTPLRFVAFLLTPQGVPIRIDEPAPE